MSKKEMNKEERLRAIKSNSEFLKNEKAIPVITMCSNRLILDGISKALCLLDNVVVLTGVTKSVLDEETVKLALATGAIIVGSDIEPPDEIYGEEGEIYILDMHVDEEALRQKSIIGQKTCPELNSIPIEELMEECLINYVQNYPSLLSILQEFNSKRKKTVSEIEEVLINTVIQ